MGCRTRSIWRCSGAADPAHRAARRVAVRRSVGNGGGSFEPRGRHPERHVACHSKRVVARTGRHAEFVFGDCAGQAGRQGTELQFRYRLDVRLFRTGNRRLGAYGEGVFQARGQPDDGDPLGVFRRRGCAIGWICGCGPTGATARFASRSKARRTITQHAARDWELQMLIKARLAAGDAEPCRELLEFVEPLIYKTTTDFRTVEAVSETRARIHEKQARKGKQAWRQCQARAGRHPRYRVSGAVPAEAARGARAVGAAWRDAAGAVPASRQGTAFEFGIFPACARPISSCGIWNTGCSSTRTGRRTRCRAAKKNSMCWPARCRRGWRALPSASGLERELDRQLR